MRIGTIVQYKIAKGKSAGQLRPAIVIRSVGGACDLKVFVAGFCDAGWEGEAFNDPQKDAVVLSVPCGTDPGCWSHIP